MKHTLKDILYGVSIQSVLGDTSIEVSELTFDSRKAKKGSVFFAIKGTQVDGHDYIQSAIDNGCQTFIISKKAELPPNLTVVTVDDTAKTLGIVASNFYGEPSKEITLIGVTGTNGKTTTSTLLHQMFTKLGYKSGLLSTVVNKIGEKEITSTHTTPNPIELNKLLREMVQKGCTHCFMEVSSHAIHQKRIEGVHFSGGVFTNITHDHLDYHKTFKEYRDVKKSFFDHLPKSAFTLTNADDKNGLFMLQNTKAKKVTYALKSQADYKAKVLENHFSGLVLSINNKEIWTKLIGDFNAYNLLAVFGVSQELGIDETEALTAISNLDPVEGRFQYLQSPSGITAIIDYAHTPDALKNVLKTIENIRTKNETVFTIFGCGGDRDKEKRPEMAKEACAYSDKVIITSDNPRTEAPEEIIDDIMKGVDAVSFKKTLSIIDRKQAIKTALSMAESGDIILIAGKGHEKYQEINGVKHPFDDMETVKELLTKLEK